jgi:hypothetical protein
MAPLIETVLIWTSITLCCAIVVFGAVSISSHHRDTQVTCASQATMTPFCKAWLNAGVVQTDIVDQKRKKK